MVKFVILPPYAVNNFPSSYVLPVLPSAKRVLHVGEIDVAINSLARDSAEKVYVVDMNPTTVALGLWKKECMKQVDSPDDYASLLYLLGFSCANFSALRRRAEQLKPVQCEISRRILQQLPDYERRLVEDDMEASRRNPYHRIDNGTVRNLHYLEWYQKIRERLDRLEILHGDIQATVQQMNGNGNFGLVSLNNISDYLSDEEKRALSSQLGRRMLPGGRLVAASRHAFTPNGFTQVSDEIVNDFELIKEEQDPERTPFFKGSRFRLFAEKTPAFLRYEFMGANGISVNSMRVDVYKK